jgi:hypothetical protein
MAAAQPTRAPQPEPTAERPLPRQFMRTHLTSVLALRATGDPRMSAAAPGVMSGTRPAGPGAGPRGFGLPSIRRNVCPHFYLTGSRGAIPIQAPHLLKSLIRQPSNVSRCQLRGGVHLDESYVNDVCLTPRFNQCVFYEDELSRE